MKKILLIIPAILLMLNCFSQELRTMTSNLDDTVEPSAQDVRYAVNIVAKGHTISKHKLGEARTLVDLNMHYKSSWVRTFHSVEISTTQNGKPRNVVGKNDILTQEQKDLMMMADDGTAITVNIEYIPENTLKHNDMKKWDFKFVVNPESDAEFLGGPEQLNQYLKVHAIDKIPEGSFKEFDLTPVVFTIDELGKIIDVHVYEPSENPKIDALLIEVVRNMPQWKPAAYSATHQVKQDFVLTVGNMKSCVVNLLNIRKE